MNSTKILIGSGILIGAAGVAYLLVKRSQASPEADSTGSALTAGNGVAPSGTKPLRYAEGTLLRAGNSSDVYIIDAQGSRHWISNRGAFDRMGLNMSNVKSISTVEMEAIPRAQNISGLTGILF